MFVAERPHNPSLIMTQEIVTTCSSANADFVKSMGATSMVDYKAETGQRSICRYILGGGFEYFLFSSLFGEMIQCD